MRHARPDGMQPSPSLALPRLSSAPLLSCCSSHNLNKIFHMLPDGEMWLPPWVGGSCLAGAVGSSGPPPPSCRRLPSPSGWIPLFPPHLHVSAEANSAICGVKLRRCCCSQTSAATQAGEGDVEVLMAYVPGWEAGWQMSQKSCGNMPWKRVRDQSDALDRCP